MTEASRISRVALPKGAPFRWVLDFLQAKFHHMPPGVWLERLNSGKICAESGTPVTANSAYAEFAGQRLHYVRESPNEPDIPFSHSIVFEDELILVADKPHFLPVVPAGIYVRQSLLWRLREAGYDAELTPAHRIDQGTAGLLLLIKSAAHRAAYQNLFRDRLVQKTYHAIAGFNADLFLPMLYRSRLIPGDHFMQMQTGSGVPNCECAIELLQRSAERALYQLKPLTGRRHQLRVQMAALGLPIENDPIYPTLLAKEDYLDFSKPLQLLAQRLAFTDPINHSERCFDSAQTLKLSAN